MTELLTPIKSTGIKDEETMRKLKKFNKKLSELNKIDIKSRNFEFYQKASTLCGNICRFSEYSLSAAHLMTPNLLKLLQSEDKRNYDAAGDRLILGQNSTELQIIVAKIFANFEYPEFVRIYQSSNKDIKKAIEILVGKLIYSSHHDIQKNILIILSDLTQTIPDTVATVTSNQFSSCSVFRIIAETVIASPKDSKVIKSGIRLLSVLATRDTQPESAVDVEKVSYILDIGVQSDANLLYISRLSAIYDTDHSLYVQSDLPKINNNDPLETLTTVIWSHQIENHNELTRSVGEAIALLPDIGPNDRWINILAERVRQPDGISRIFVTHALGGTVALPPSLTDDKDATNQLTESITLPVGYKRYSAARALGGTVGLVPNVGPEYTLPLVKRIRNPSGNSPQIAAHALGEAVNLVPEADSGRDIIEDLIESIRRSEDVIKDSQNLALGEIAAVTLQTTSEEEWIQPLIDTVQQREGTPREQAARLLGITLSSMPDERPDEEWIQKMASVAQNFIGSHRDEIILALGTVVALIPNLGPDGEWVEALSEAVHLQKVPLRPARTLGRAVALLQHVDSQGKWLEELVESVKQYNGSDYQKAVLTLGEIVLMYPEIVSNSSLSRALAKEVNLYTDSTPNSGAKLMGEVLISTSDIGSIRSQSETLTKLVRQSEGLTRYRATRALGQVAIESPNVAPDDHQMRLLIKELRQRGEPTRDSVTRELGETIAIVSSPNTNGELVEVLAEKIRVQSGIQRRDLARALGEIVALLPEIRPDNVWMRSLAENANQFKGQARNGTILALGEIATVSIHTDSDYKPRKALVEAIQRADGSSRDSVAQSIGMAAATIGSDEISDSVSLKLVRRMEETNSKNKKQKIATTVGHSISKTPEKYVIELAASLANGGRLSASKRNSLQHLAETGHWTLEEFIQLLRKAADSPDTKGIDPYMKTDESSRRVILEALIRLAKNTHEPRSQQTIEQIHDSLSEAKNWPVATRLIAIELLTIIAS